MIKTTIPALIVLIFFNPIKEENIQVSAKEEIKEPEIQLTGELKRICSCESTGSPNQEPIHYDRNGNVLRGKINPQDIGMCQINLTYHQKEAEKLQLDLFKEKDNMLYAMHLYQTQGNKPWNWSKHCWE